MTESVIVGGCVRTLLFTIAGLMQCDGICAAEIEGCTNPLIVYVIKTGGWG